VVLADASKLGAAPFHAWAKLPEKWTLVTDDSATEEQLEPFHDAGVEVLMAKVEEPGCGSRPRSI
jgi:Transcriptional regulators of sugar metabolism